MLHKIDVGPTPTISHLKSPVSIFEELRETAYIYEQLTGDIHPIDAYLADMEEALNGNNKHVHKNYHSTCREILSG
jgi:hypothetical protein